MSLIYPSHLMRHVLWRGEELLIRPVRADDAPRYVEGAKRCSVEDLRFRFLNGVHQISQALIARLTQIDYEQHMAFVAEGLKGDLMAVTRLVRDGCQKTAEFAVIVRTDLQRQGLGTLMQKMLLEYATELGLKEVWGLVDCENRKALNLVSKLGFSRGFQIGHPFARVVKVLA